MKFKIGRTEIEISFLFTVVLCIMFFFDNTGNLLLFFLSAAVHEAGHLMFMVLLKAVPDKIRLIPGGIFIVDSSVNSTSEDILILISGPFFNFLCYMLFSGDFALINLLLFIYNILPVRSLDGGSLIFIVFNHFTGEKAANTILNISTLAVSAGFLMLFFLQLADRTVNYSLLIFSLYLVSGLFLKKGVERRG